MDEDPVVAAAIDELSAVREGTPPPAEQEERAREVREVGFTGEYMGRNGHKTAWRRPWYQIGPDGEPVPVPRSGSILRCADCEQEFETRRPDQSERCPACQRKRAAQLSGQRLRLIARRRAALARARPSRAYADVGFREMQRYESEGGHDCPQAGHE